MIWSNNLPPILTYFETVHVSYKNHIVIKHHTEDTYHFNLDIIHHCSIAVYLRRHLNEPIPAIL